MPLDSSAFERYRRTPNEKTTLFRLILGVLIVVVLWFGTTMAVLFAGSYGLLMHAGNDAAGGGEPIQRFLGSASGIFATLLTFAGIWIGVWIAMRFLHKEKLAALYGVSASLSRSAFLKGFAAVAITSLLTEIAYLMVMPGLSRGPTGLGTWLVLFLPLALFAFIQTSAEELLFRGYLQRGLAYLYRSPVIWAVLPTLVFTALHWNPASPLAMNIAVVISIGAFAALLALLVYATGNLGAAMGAHLGNNLMGFALISHDQTLGGLALFQAPPLDSLAWTPGETSLIVGISIVSIMLTWLLLLHPRSPLKVMQDRG